MRTDLVSSPVNLAWNDTLLLSERELEGKSFDEIVDIMARFYIQNLRKYHITFSYDRAKNHVMDNVQEDDD